MIRKFTTIVNEAAPVQAPAPAPAQASLDTPPQAQPPAQGQPADQPPAQGQAQPSGTTQGQSQGEPKSGDLSNYDNRDATKFSNTVKKMVDLLKDMDKKQLMAVRKCIAEQKGIEDEKGEIGKL